MSDGAIHVTGTIADSALGPVLHTDGGGEWELGNARKIRKLMGKRVAIVGRRVGFNELSCDKIWCEGAVRPRRARVSLELLLTAVFVAYGLFTNFKGLFD